MATKKETKVKDIDITKSGPMTYRNLQAANAAQYTNLSPEMQAFSKEVEASTAPTSLYDARNQGESLVRSSLSNTSTTWGKSIYDNPIATEEQFQNLGDIRAENEPWYAKIAAGIGKGAILTGTTFLDGTVGLLFGTGTAITEGRWSGLWDNDFSKAMQAINEKSEEWMPNYYTQKEQETPWYENIFTANFLGDKFIKNLGFTIGAFYSGGVTAAGLKVTKLPQLIGAITKMTKAPAMVTSTVGAVTSAVNEGIIEALNNSKDWFNLHKAQLDDNYRERIQRLQSIYEDNKGSLVKTKDGNFIDPAYLEYQKALQKERESYNSALGKLSEDRLKMGNVDLLMNLPILMASNIIQFGKMYANGFKTARKATNIVGRAGEYSTSKSTLGNIWNVSKGALSEGGEEISQKAASTISGNYYETDVNNYYKAKTDPKASQDTLSWTKAFAQGINETVNEGSSWEEFFIGALTGALGIPKFRSMKNAEGKFQSPITIEGGAINGWREYNEKKARDQELADALNARVNSPEFRNYYQGLIRHNKYQGDMNQAAENNDEFSFKNAEHAQLVSDISMFDNAGKLEDLYTLLDASFDTSDENLRAIVEHTTSTQENGEKIGPFVDSKGNPMYATPEGKEEMIKKLTENKEEITNAIKEYLKIKNDIDSRTGEQLTDDQLEELTWMRSQLGNWSKRSVEMSADVKKAISSIIGNLSPLLQFYEAVRDSEGKPSADLTETYREADENIQFLNKVIGTLDKVRNYSNEALAAVLAQNSKYVDFLIKELNKVDDSSVSKEDKDSTIAKLKDIQKLGNASKIYNEKLNEYLKNPQKQAEDHAKADEEAATQESKKKSDDLKASLKNAKNVREFREILDKEDDEETRNKVLKELEDEDNKLAKNHKELNQYHREVQRAINESDAEPQAKQDALTLLRDQYNNSEDLQQVANPNSIYVNNTNAFDEESEGDVELSATRFTNAQYELQRAMSKVNNDIKFKDRFSPEYRRPVENNKNSISNTIETRSGKKVTGTYKKTTDTDGFTHVKYEGPGIARFRIKSGDYGLSLDDLIGSKDEYESEDSYNEVVADATSDGLEIGNSTLRPDGSVSIETENGITIEGDAAKLIYDKLFNPIVRGDDRINTGSDATSTTPPVGNNNKGNNKGGKPKTDDELDAEETNGTAVGNVTKEMVAEENKATNARVESPQVKKSETKKYYRPAIPELHIEASKDGDFRAFDIVVKEKEGADFSEIYNYLRDKGVFEYLNSGKLKVGDDIGFMIDPEFEKKVEGQEWHKAPTIFLINKKDGQIVGSLDEGSSITNFEGLAGLEERIRKEYNQRNSQSQQEQSKLGELRTIKKTVVGTSSNYEVEVYETPISLKDAEPNTTIISPKGDKQLLVISNNKEEGYLIVKNILGGKEQLYDYTGNKKGTLPAWVDSKGDTKVYVLAKFQSTNQDISQFADNELVEFASTQNTGFHTTSEGKSSLKEKITDIGKEEAGWGSVNGITYYKVNVGGRNDYVAAYFRTEPTSEIKKAVEAILNDSNLDYPLAQKKIADLIRNNSVSNQITDISKAEKDDLIYITNTSQGYSSLGNMQEWSQKVSDIRKFPDGFGTHNGLFYYKHSDKAGRVGDNITIWFRNEPSQRVKDSIESLLNSSKNLIEFGDKVVKLLKEDNANLINNSNATQTNTQTSVNSNKPFIASPTTKVSKVMVGKIPYRNSERSLKDIPKVTTDDHKPLFGIIKNGVLVTNNKVADNLIIKPMDMSKEGRLYLLVPNGAGKYSPVAVRVKHFNDEEFNLNDKEIAETPLGKSIIGGINKLVQSTSQDDVSNAMKDLAKNLHLQDVMITWFEGNKGSGIVISKKVKNADGSYQKTTINGKEQIVEEKTDIYFNTKAGVINTGGLEIEGDAAAQLGIDTSDTGKPKDSDAIYNEILNALLKLNVPLQVSARRINDGAYNARLINSNILTSNISEAATKGTWFTTDHFDDNGNLQKANNPQSVPKPKKGTGDKGAIIGTRVYFGKQTYYVNLENNTITNSKGKSIEINDSNRILLDIAWANSTFGNARVSTNMINNKVITPSGRILDRDTNKYLTGETADSIRSQIEAANKGRKDAKAKTQKTIDEIYENQKKVDKLKTDGDFYYILEDDGEYHPYDRVHSRLGSNWKESIKQKKALDLIKYNLSKQSDDISLYNNYLDYLKRHYKEYKIDFDQYKGKTDVKTREAIVNTIRDAMSNTNSQRALAAGTAIDSVIRQFFTIKDISKITKPDNLTEQAYVDLITTLNEIKENIERLGETFLADNIVLFQKYPDGTRVAGEVDILAVDKNGNFKIYDVKTSRYSFHDFTDKYGHKVNYFRNASRTQTMSTEAYYTLQLSAYKNLFESQYGVPITSLALMPFVLSYDKENRVTNIQNEKGISIAYNPAVNVPLIGNVQSTNLKPQGQDITQKGKGSNNQDNSNQGNNNQGNQGTQNNTDSRFNNSLESLNPVNDVDDNHKFENGNTIGYFELNGKLHKGYLKELTTINGYKIYLTKVPNLTKGFGKSEEHVASNNYYAIFPNGKVYEVARNVPITENTKESYMADEIKSLLSKNPKKVADLSTEKTLLFDPKTTTNTTANTEIKPTIPSTENTANTETIKGKEGTGGAAAATAKLQAVNDNDEDYEDEFELRKVDDISRTVWNQERELKWLNKVLPNLSTSDRVKVVKGLIEVGSKGTKAWGKFSKGIITLSDIAAEGTTYHEAFHAVFNLLLDNNEKQALYDEARKLYGEKDNLSLEEDMAEGFREYVMTRQNAGLLIKIKNFFKDLWVKVTNWNKIQPHLMAYYQMINNGKYNNREVEIESIKDIDTRYKEIPNSSFEKLDSNYQERLLKKGWTEEKFNSISQEERDNAIKCVAF